MNAADDLSKLGVDVTRYNVGSHRLPCPNCAKNAKDDTFGLTVEPSGAAVWHCHRCHFKGATSGRSGRPYQPRPRLPEAAAKPVKIDPDRLFLAMAIVESSLPIEASDPAGKYLLARRCVLPPEGSDLRWIEHRRHPSSWIGPCLLAIATDAVTGELRTIHQTWINPAEPGQKASVKTPRLLFGGLPKAGSVVRLWSDEDVIAGLAIGEGIETCLAAAHGYTPIWCTLDAGNMAVFPVLPGVESLTLIVDHDPASKNAAEGCASRWYAAGREVRVWCSPVSGEDAAAFAERVA